MEPPAPKFILKKAGKPVTCLNFWNHFPSSSEKGINQAEPFLLAGYSEEGGIDVWNMKTRRSTSHFPCKDGIVSVEGNNDGEIITLTKEGDLRLLDCKNGQIQSKLNLHVSTVGFCKASCINLDNGVTMVAVPGEENSSVSVWNLKEQKLLYKLLPGSEYKFGMVMCVKIFHIQDELHALCGYEDGSVLLWDVFNENLLHQLQLHSFEPVMGMDFDIKTHCGVAGSPSNILTKFSFDGNGINVVKRRTQLNAGIADIQIRPDGKIVSVAGWDGNVRIFSWKTLKPLAVLKYHDTTVQTLAFRQHQDSSNQILASGSADHKIAIWEIYN